MRVYEFAEVSMKFERHTDAETINFEILSDDWTKSALLQTDRSIELHSQGGIHYRTRIPKFGRDLAYHFPTCDLMIAASSQEVYRLNLEQGRFLNSIQTDGTEGVNCIKINPAHQLFGFGTGNGTVELWDPRSRARVGVLDQLPIPTSYDQPTHTEVTALAFRNDGLNMGVGTNTGHTLLYDLRTSVPYIVKDHQYGFPIKNIHFHDGVSATKQGDFETGQGGDKLIVADKKIVKIWDRNTGKHFTSIEPETDINDICMVGDSGLLFTAQEGIQMGAYFIPQLGPAPRWASFLENLTEEMEENPNRDVYDEYKFVTRKELAALGLEHLMGTNVLKAYMHGFFVDLRLYEKAKLIANPFEYDDYKERKVREKLEKERASRIRANNKLPAVNKQLAKQLLEESTDDKKKKKKTDTSIMEDDRFKAMFADPEFEVDMDSKEYELLHPGIKQKQSKKDKHDSDNEDEDEDEMMNDDEEDDEDVDSDDSDRLNGDSDSDEDLVSKIRKERYGSKSKSIEKPKPITTLRSTERKFKSSENKSFGSRLQSSKAKKSNQGHRVSRTAMGGMEMSFKPKSGTPTRRSRS
ncbi:unnamed protein product [Cunninghamella echinulata]